MNAQEQFWAGPDGDAYTHRNRYDWRLRIPFWQKIIDLTGARSVYEFGCNVGYNLSAIRRAFPDVAVAGEDLNEQAVSRAIHAGNLLEVFLSRDDICSQRRELAFTAGVLIHIAPADLELFMRRVISASCDWVLAIEYPPQDSPRGEEPIDYRGRAGLLWRRNYGALYEHLGLKIVDYGELTKPAFDNCSYWLMRKP